MNLNEMTNEKLEARSLRQGVEARIRRLRTLVDRIEGEALGNLTRAERGEGRYSSVAEVFVKELPQGIVNVGVEQLVHYATTADIYHAETKVEAQREQEGQA